MVLTWEELEKDIQIRNVATMEVEDRLGVLESMVKSDITKLCVQTHARRDFRFYARYKNHAIEFPKKGFRKRSVATWGIYN